MRILLWLGAVLLLTAESKAQTVLPDSIRQQLKGNSEDSAYVMRLNAMATDYLRRSPALSRRIAAYSGEVSRKIQYNKGYARSLTVIGNSYWYEGIYEFAQNYYMLAARHYQDAHDNIGLGKVYNNIGEVNKKLGDFDQALNYLIRSIELRPQDSTLGLTLYNIAELYMLQKKYPEAEEYVRKSSSYATKFNDERAQMYNIWLTGKLKLERKSFPEALYYLQRAIEGWTNSGELRNLIQTYHDMAEAYRLQNNAVKASEYLRRCLSLETELYVPELKAQTYLGLARLDSTLGNYEDAYRHLLRHNSLKDSVYNVSKVEQIARVQAIYETERMDRENEQLKSDKKLRDEQLKSREGLLVAITASLIVVGLLAAMLFQQRFRILKNNKVLHQKNEEIVSQKHSIELQAVTLMKLNEELNNLNKTLETRIDERSKQLVIQDRKLAEYSFINAHKLRAPVASILGLIQLISQVSPEDRPTILAHLKTCADQLDAIIQEISRSLEGNSNS